MKRTFPAILTVLVLAGCGPVTVRQSSETPLPTETRKQVSIADLRVSVNDKSMIVSWKRIGQGAISGYNIYISERPLFALYPDAHVDSSIAPYNATPFPGDTNPEDSVENFEATHLENGVKYFVTVRVVFPDGLVSRPSSEVTVVCGPRGEIELPIRYQSSPDGYSFEKNAYTDANSTDNDLYFYSKDGRDYLASPRRLDGFINDTRFLVLPFRGS
ncbi:MAG: fibronectin type III domain-containing protein, partial [candidate division Zixibacteria bacterium]|nr:fibronectin type III domain-containing protein [candidate division Zixibacteria bacterium]